MPDPLIDRLQFRLSLAEAEIHRLQARVAALERGAPLPPDQRPEMQPEEPVPQLPRSEPEPLEIPELDLLSGHGLTAGPIRR